MKVSPRKFVNHLKDRMRLNKRSFIVYSILRALVIITAIRCFIEGNFESFALCLLSLVLFLLPSFFEEKLKVAVPPLFESLIYLFIYAAEILGEVNRYYTEIPGWDTMLHTINGFLCAAIGFSLVDILNRKSRNISLSPQYLALVAFCFSMTVGVMWEFIEFAMDNFFYVDMQKDYIIHDIGSVKLDTTGSQIPVQIHKITKTIIETASGKKITVNGGYLDIGLIDTMKDLLVNFIGALVFSIIGYFYEKNRILNNGKEEKAPDRKEDERKANHSSRGSHSRTSHSSVTAIAGDLKLSALTDEELAAQQKTLEERSAAYAAERKRRLRQVEEDLIGRKK